MSDKNNDLPAGTVRIHTGADGSTFLVGFEGKTLDGTPVEATIEVPESGLPMALQALLQAASNAPDRLQQDVTKLCLEWIEAGQETPN